MVVVVKYLPANPGDIKRWGFDPWVGKIAWRRAWQPTLVLLPGEFHGQRSLVGYSPWGGKRIRHNWATNTHTQLQNSLAFPSLPPAIGLFAENVLFFTILFLLRIYLSRDIQKNYCLLKMLKIVPLWWKCMLPVDFILLLIFRNCFFKFSFSFIII